MTETQRFEGVTIIFQGDYRTGQNGQNFITYIFIDYITLFYIF